MAHGTCRIHTSNTSGHRLNEGGLEERLEKGDLLSLLCVALFIQIGNLYRK